MTKSELINRISQKARIKKAAAGRALETTVNSITEALQKGQKFTLSGLGTFTVSQRKARKGRNPRTGQEITIPARKGVRFKPSTRLKKRIA